MELEQLLHKLLALHAYSLTCTLLLYNSTSWVDIFGPQSLEPCKWVLCSDTSGYCFRSPLATLSHQVYSRLAHYCFQSSYHDQFAYNNDLYGSGGGGLLNPFIASCIFPRMYCHHFPPGYAHGRGRGVGPRLGLGLHSVGVVIVFSSSSKQ